MKRRTIQDILESWPYDPHQLGMRVIEGDDGRRKLQLRIDLGVLQLELDGRPDGDRPHGQDGYLEYYLGLREEHRWRRGTIEGFGLDAAACTALRDEATMVYQRYYSLFQLGWFGEVVRDTARNLQVADLLWRHAAREEDRWEMEQYRPYILMINALARVELLLADLDYAAAERVLLVAIAGIRQFLATNGDRFSADRELEVLSERRSDLDRERPQTETEMLQRRITAAVAREDYEQAADLRDALARAAARVLPPIWDEP